MKLTQYKMVLVVVAGMVAATGVYAGDNTVKTVNPVTSPVLGILSTATSAELPAKAADLLAKSDAKHLKETTIEVVKAAVGLNPAAAPAIVGSIAQACPDMAATACATAVALVPNQAVAIARAAAAACPTKAGAIVEAICRVLPADYRELAEAVAGVVPGAGKEILAGISAAIPQLKISIDQTLMSYQGVIPSVSAVLSQMSQSQSSVAANMITSGTPGPGSGLPQTTFVPTTTVQGPASGAPFVPISGTPVVITPGSGGQVPVGGGNYSAP